MKNSILKKTIFGLVVLVTAFCIITLIGDMVNTYFDHPFCKNCDNLIDNFMAGLSVLSVIGLLMYLAYIIGNEVLGD